ncbi:unnamed protein product [Gongylonema pulchrum]|uniref:ANK_REP_REGION domain-containing protein n=1 Tax=Gongylonema pulchrum TaxID=637853 RepID=A0A183E7V1_9BILA|nr:unnamed protein product [Gongylonema pulchrum]
MSLIRTLDEQDIIGTSRILDLTPDEVSSRDSEDRVPLHYAAETGNVELFKRLLELNNSLIDCQDQNGYTPLLVASMSGNASTIKVLLENSAQINHLDKDRHSAVHWAVVCGQVNFDHS